MNILKKEANKLTIREDCFTHQGSISHNLNTFLNKYRQLIKRYYKNNPSHSQYTNV